MSDWITAIRTALFGASTPAPDAVADTVGTVTEPELQVKEESVLQVRNQVKDWLAERAPEAKRIYDQCRVMSNKIKLMTKDPHCVSEKDWYYTWGDELSPILNQLMAARSHERQLMRTLKSSLGTMAADVSDVKRLVLQEDKAAIKECALALLALEDHFLQLPIVTRLVMHELTLLTK